MRTDGLYRAEYEHDACGIGAIAHLRGRRSHQTLDDALSVLVNLEHRGGKGLEKNTGDGAGVLFQVPHRFFRKEAQKEAAASCPTRVTTAWPCCSFRTEDEAGVAAGPRRSSSDGCADVRRAAACSGARCPLTRT